MFKLSSLFQRYRGRYEYCWVSAICLVFSNQWARELFAYTSSTHATVESFVASHLWFTLGSAFLFTLFPIAVWQRTVSLGMPGWIATICVIGITGLWGCSVSDGTRKPIVLIFFLITQVPLAIFPMKPERVPHGWPRSRF
jgi:hypothetical protein